MRKNSFGQGLAILFVVAGITKNTFECKGTKYTECF